MQNDQSIPDLIPDWAVLLFNEFGLFCCCFNCFAVSVAYFVCMLRMFVCVSGVCVRACVHARARVYVCVCVIKLSFMNKNEYNLLFFKCKPELRSR